MARQTLIKTAGTGKFPTTGVALTMTAEDATNHSQFVFTGNDIIIIQNTGAGSHTYTITSVADPQGRTGDINAVTIAAGAIHVVGPLGSPGWAQAGQPSYLFLAANHAEVKWGIYVPA